MSLNEVPAATLFGASGFIGRHLTQEFAARGMAPWCPTRADLAAGAHRGRPLGHVVYAIGLTGDFRTRPVETVEANARLLAEILHGTEWSSFLALSSTRVYGADEAAGPCREDDTLAVRPSGDAVYDLSKLLGESLVLGHPRETARVARLSNVFGPGMSEATFLGAILATARDGRPVEIGEDPRSAKDYVPVAEAVRALADIALSGRSRLYNVASGVRLTHAEVAEILRQAGATVAFLKDGPRRTLPAISVERLAAEFCPPPLDIAAALGAFVKDQTGVRP